MEFETVLKVIVMVAATVAIPVAAYAAIAAVRSVWGRPGQGALSSAGSADTDEFTALKERVRDLEVLPGRVAELEERLDFTERMLLQQREAPRLESGREGG
jgi:hypothetical protein